VSDTSSIHIGLIAPEFPPELGGVQTYSCELAAALARSGARVTVLAPALRPGEAAPPAPAGVSIHRDLKLSRKHDAGLLARHPEVQAWHGLTANCAWLINATRLPVFLSIHGNDLLSPTGAFHRPAWRKRLHLPFGSRAEYWWSLHRGRAHLANALRRGSAIFCNSNFTASLTRERSTLPKERIIVTGIGLGEDYVNLPQTTRHAADGPVRFITVSRLDEPRKNIDLVLRALALLPAGSAWVYTVIGAGHRLDEFKSLAASLGLSGKVEFTGALPRTELINRLQSADLFVLTPSVDDRSVEGFGIVYLEANACGLPVLAACTGGVPDAVQEGVSGWLIDGPSAQTIADALRRFLNAPASFDRDACRRHALRFTWDAVAARCLEAYTGPGSRS